MKTVHELWVSNAMKMPFGDITLDSVSPPIVLAVVRTKSDRVRTVHYRAADVAGLVEVLHNSGYSHMNRDVIKTVMKIASALKLDMSECLSVLFNAHPYRFPGLIAGVIVRSDEVERNTFATYSFNILSAVRYLMILSEIENNMADPNWFRVNRPSVSDMLKSVIDVYRSVYDMPRVRVVERYAYSDLYMTDDEIEAVRDSIMISRRLIVDSIHGMLMRSMAIADMYDSDDMRSVIKMLVE